MKKDVEILEFEWTHWLAPNYFMLHNLTFSFIFHQVHLVVFRCHLSKEAIQNEINSGKLKAAADDNVPGES